MFSMIKVQGNSMVPRLYNGDFVFISRWHRQIKIGQLVVVDHTLYRFIVKKVADVSPDGLLWLTGENNESLQPEKMGWIYPNQVVGKVIYCICANRKSS